MVRRPELRTGSELRGEEGAALWAARRERRAYREGVERREGAGWCWWEHRERRGGGGGTLETGEGGGGASEKYRPFRRKITDEKYRC